MLNRERKKIKCYLNSIDTRIWQIKAFMDEIEDILSQDEKRQKPKNRQQKDEKGRFT